MVTPTIRERPYQVRQGDQPPKPAIIRAVRLCLLALLLLAVPAHATAITVSTQQTYTSGTAADGAWREVVLPAWTAYVWIEVSGSAYVDGIGGGYTDGASRSSGGRLTASSEVIGLPIPWGSTRHSIWVAGSGASRTVTVIAFGKEAE